MALELASPGAGLILHYHQNEEAAHEVAEACLQRGATVHLVPGSLHSPDDIRAIAAKTKQHAPRLDGLVNNAGIYAGKSLLDTTLDDWDHMMAVNLRAVFLLIQSVVPFLQDGGSIVNTASIMGISPSAGAHEYQASKAAIIHLTKSLALELAPAIRVNCVSPGFVMTDMNRDGWEDADFQQQVIAETPLRRWGRPTDIAPAVRFLLSDESSFITGQTLAIDGGKGL